jgi:hypothetical protein
MSIKELGPFITGTQVLRMALNASFVEHSVCFVCGIQLAKKRSINKRPIDLKPTIVSFLFVPSQALSDVSLKFLRLVRIGELWVDSIVLVC